MTKPDDISQQAWDEAEAVGEAIHGRHERGWVAWPLISEAGPSPQEIVARAIMAATAAERERCALVAEEHRKSPRYSEWPYATACADITTAIRQGYQPPKPFPHMGAMEI